MELRKIRLDQIKPYSGNAKEHPEEQVEQIKESIRAFGMNDPIAVDETGEIIEGHGRYMALRELGEEEAPVLVIEGLTEEQKRAYRLVHNRLTMNSGFDLRALESELEKIRSFDMEALGFDLEELAADLTRLEDESAEVEEDVFDPEQMDEETEEEPVTKPGDLIRLGDHFLLCGDATKAEDIARLMDAFGEGAGADLVLTDPPYGVDYSSKNEFLNRVAKGNRNQTPIENDSLDNTALTAFLSDSFRAMRERMRPGAAYYVWHPQMRADCFMKALQRAGMRPRQCLIWVKNIHVLGMNDYQWKHEPCWYGWKEGAAHFFKDSRVEMSVFDDAPSLAKMTKEQLKDYAKQLLAAMPASTIIREDKPSRSAEHPTMKPVRLFGRLMQNSSKRGDIVLDPFLGSGTTIIAAEQLGRRGGGLELEPRYCDIIVRRWEDFTGKTAERP